MSAATTDAATAASTAATAAAATTANSAFATKLANGATIPLHGFGTWAGGTSEKETALTAEGVEAAIRIGYRHIDGAAVYNNEKQVGAAIAKVIGEGVVKREELFVVSKLWNSFHRREHVRPSLEKTLKDLGLAYLDLYLIHWPIAFKYPGTLHASTVRDEATGDVLFDLVSVAETWEALEECVDAGLVRSLGVSNFNVQLLAEVLAVAKRHRPQVNQVELHPYLAQPLLQQFCAKHGIHLTAYSPLGGAEKPDGTRKPQAGLLQDPAVLAIAQRHNATPAQVLIRFHLQAQRSVIPKSFTPARLRDNFAALTALVLDADDLAQLAALDRNVRINGAPEGWGYPVFG